MHPSTQQRRVAGALFSYFLPLMAAAAAIDDQRPRRRIGEPGIRKYRRYRKMRLKMAKASRRNNRSK